MWPAVGTSNSTKLFFLLDLVECCLLRMPILIVNEDVVSKSESECMRCRNYKRKVRVLEFMRSKGK